MNRFSRRRFLSGTGAGLASVTLPNLLCGQEASFDCHAVIIGAGPAGLAAAHELQIHGKSFIMLEARDRIGGRVFTDTSLGPPFDAGATFIHFADQNPWQTVANAMGFATMSTYGLAATHRYFVNGAPVAETEKPPSYRELQSYFGDDEDDVADVSFVERFAHLPTDMQRGAATLARLDVGEEPERVSARDYARLWDGPNSLVPSGFGRLVAAYGAGLPVKLSTAARSIDWSGAGVKVATDAGTIRARAVIITVSVGVLASSALRFVPDLPPQTKTGIDGLSMGALTKVALAFDGNRFDVPIQAKLSDQKDRRAEFEFDCWSFDRDIVVAWFGGDQARELARRGEREAVATVLDRFGTIVGADVAAHLIGGRLCDWCTDPLTMGCYSHALPGQAKARALLAAPVGERLYFAGEATGSAPHDDFGPAMTAGGAFLAGRAAARRVADL